MRRVFRVLLVAGTLAGCSGQSSPIERTLVAQNDMLATQMADIYTTATVAADRLQVTLAFVETAAAQLQQQNQRLAATIDTLGGNAAAVVPVASTPTLPPANAAAPLTTPEAAAPEAAGTVQVATPTGAPPVLYNVVTAREVGANDCALAPVNSFSAADTRIYIVATAANIAPGTTLASRWFRDGAEVILHDFTPDFAIEQNCVWFFIDPEETPFSAGSWSVQLEINGAAVGAPVAFTIAG